MLEVESRETSYTVISTGACLNVVSRRRSSGETQSSRGCTASFSPSKRRAFREIGPRTSRTRTSVEMQGRCWEIWEHRGSVPQIVVHRNSETATVVVDILRSRMCTTPKPPSKDARGRLRAHSTRGLPFRLVSGFAHRGFCYHRTNDDRNSHPPHMKSTMLVRQTDENSNIGIPTRTHPL